MNYGIIRYIIGKVIEIEGAFFVIPVLTALVYHEWSGLGVYVLLACLYMFAGFIMSSKEPGKKEFYAREGYVLAALAWIIMSILGAIPFVITGDIPSMADAVFEIASGFTTTGASILTSPEPLLKCNLMWRSFSHWIGGMGVLVFLIAILPSGGGESIYIMRAESTGPSVGKIVPRIKQTSKILYEIYTALTFILFVLLVLGRMPVFDAICLTFGAAGTGGFGILADSVASYNTYCQVVITIFMLLFGVNFTFFYMLLIGKARDAFRMEEVRGYLAIYCAITLLITLNLWAQNGHFMHQLQQVSFQTSSVMTTTGYSTQDFNAWPQFSKILMGLLMAIGGCTGSTGGGIKVSRILVYVKGIIKEISEQVHPRRVKVLRVDGKRVDDSILRAIYIYLALYTLIFVIIKSIDSDRFCKYLSVFINRICNLRNRIGNNRKTAFFSLYIFIYKSAGFTVILNRKLLLPLIKLKRFLFIHRSERLLTKHFYYSRSCKCSCLRLILFISCLKRTKLSCHKIIIKIQRIIKSVVIIHLLIRAC